MRTNGSRMAYIGSNTLNSSAIQDPDSYMIPTYSAFNGRVQNNLLKDFHHELSSLRTSKKSQPVMNTGGSMDKRARRTNTQPPINPETESVHTEPDIIDNVQMIQPQFTKKNKQQPINKNKSLRQSEYREPIQRQPNSFDTDRIMLELMNLKQKININQALRVQQQAPPQRNSQLQQKMLQYIMRLPQHQQAPSNQPIIIQSPPVPNYYPPPQYPYMPPPQIQKKLESSEQPKKKNTKYIRRKLKKIFWAVAFPFLLKAYSKKLRCVRKQYLVNNMGSLLQQSVDLIKQWFLDASSKSFAMIVKKIDMSLQYNKEKDQQICNQKMKCICTLIDMIINNLDKNSKPEIIREFLPFISVTCDDRTFIPEDFITNKQLSYIAFSEDHEYQLLYPDLQLIQVIVFVFIKVIVYNILFQPWRFDKNLKKQPIQQNLSILGYVIYYCADQLINQKLKNIKPKNYHAGNMVGNNTPYPLIYDKTLQYQEDKLSYLHCVNPKEFVDKIKNYKRGEAWQGWKSMIEKIGVKLYKQMVRKRPILRNTFKQLELKYTKKQDEY